MQIIIRFLKKYKTLISYVFWGGLTTLVNYAVHFPLNCLAGFSAALSGGIAWFVAVLFSFFTNKPFVFESKDWSFRSTVRELLNFVGCRLLTGALETASLFFFVDYLKFNGVLWKVIISVAVVILNYIFSRIFVFKNKQHPVC